MNSIIYISDVYSDEFPSNSNGAFTCNINERKLDYISKTVISVAVKSITLRLTQDLYENLEYLQKTVFAIKSNISHNLTVKSSKFSDIIATFTISDRLDENSAVSIFFENPSFYPTTVELLRTAVFNIINLDNNQIINSPNERTIINCCIKPQNITMKPPIQFMLESNDVESQKLFPSNTQMKYTVKLPRRYNFEHEEWGVCLKSFHMTNRLYNVMGNKFWIEVLYYEFTESESSTNKNIKKVDGGSTSLRKLVMNSGFYGTPTRFMGEINRLLRSAKLPISLSRNNRGNFSFSWVKNTNNPEWKTRLSITLSTEMATALGFQKRLSSSPWVYNFSSGKVTNKNPQITTKAATYTPNLFVLSPKEVCIQCNIIDEMCVGRESMQILGFASLVGKYDSNTITVYMKTNEYSKLFLKSFESIDIRLTNLQGDLLEFDNAHSSPTIVNIMLVNL